MGAPGMRLSLRSYGSRLVTHTHDFEQIVLPVAGQLDQRAGVLAGAITPGRYVVIGRGVPHSFRATSPNRFVVLDTERPIAGVASAIRPLDGTLAELVRYAAAELASGALGAEMEFHLAGLLATKIGRASAVAGHADPVTQALALIAAHHAERLTIAAVADAAGLGSSQFHAVFRRQTGKAPGAMLADIRLDRACAMLRDTTLPIAEIALAVGFSDQTVLTRCLRRRRATTPDAVRRQAQPRS